MLGLLLLVGVSVGDRTAESGEGVVGELRDEELHAARKIHENRSKLRILAPREVEDRLQSEALNLSISVG